MATKPRKEKSCLILHFGNDPDLMFWAYKNYGSVTAMDSRQVFHEQTFRKRKALEKEVGKGIIQTICRPPHQALFSGVVAHDDVFLLHSEDVLIYRILILSRLFFHGEIEPSLEWLGSPRKMTMGGTDFNCYNVKNTTYQQRFLNDE